MFIDTHRLMIAIPGITYDKELYRGSRLGSIAKFNVPDLDTPLGTLYLQELSLSKSHWEGIGRERDYDPEIELRDDDDYNPSP